jgi:hypothetical protein
MQKWYWVNMTEERSMKRGAKDIQAPNEHFQPIHDVDEQWLVCFSASLDFQISRSTSFKLNACPGLVLNMFDILTL